MAQPADMPAESLPWVSVEKEYRVDTDGKKGARRAIQRALPTADRRERHRRPKESNERSNGDGEHAIHKADPGPGGTGKTGRRVVERLRARGLPVRVGSRAGAPPFDWEDRATWARALAETGAVYLTYYPDIAVPGALEATASFAELAVQSGVPRLALLSGRGEPEAERAEQAVRETGAELTVLRSTWFMQNLSEDYMLEHVLSGEIRLPAGDVPTPFLDADDIADVAVAALTDDRHIGRLYELTGPRSLTFDQVAAELTAAIGREIRYVPVSLEQHAAEAADHGVPAEVVEADLPVQRGGGRPQRRHDGRCPAGARPRAAGLRRLCAERRRDGGLGLGHSGRLSAAAELSLSAVIDGGSRCPLKTQAKRPPPSCPRRGARSSPVCVGIGCSHAGAHRRGVLRLRGLGDAWPRPGRRPHARRRDAADHRGDRELHWRRDGVSGH
jgi:uncharacterized protein YbjT (DUF2867 family)